MCMSVRDNHKRIKPRSHFHSTYFEINVPSSYGHKNAEECIEWKMKVEKTFYYLQVDEFSKISIAMLSFQDMPSHGGNKGKMML